MASSRDCNCDRAALDVKETATHVKCSNRANVQTPRTVGPGPAGPGAPGDFVRLAGITVRLRDSCRGWSIPA